MLFVSIKTAYAVGLSVQTSTSNGREYHKLYVSGVTQNYPSRMSLQLSRDGVSNWVTQGNQFINWAQGFKLIGITQYNGEETVYEDNVAQYFRFYPTLGSDKVCYREYYDFDNNFNNGSYSNVACSTPSVSTPSAPSVSISNDCSATNTKNVTIRFSASGATYYNIMRNGSWIATGYTGTSYTDYNQPKYSSIPYQVQACNTSGCGPLSSATYSYSCTQTQPSGQVILYNDSNYGGISLPISNPNVYCTQLPSYFNDITSSLRVPSGMNITLWENGDCSGLSQTYYSDTSYVGNNYNDKFSAYGWSVPKPTNFSFSISSSCDTDCNYQNNIISFSATNATYFKIMYWNSNSQWEQLGISYGSSYVDKIPKNTYRYYLVEAWNSAGYVNANPVYRQSEILNCYCGVNTPSLSVKRNCIDPINNKLSWTNLGIYPAKDYLIHRMDSDNPSWNSINSCGAIPGYAWAYYNDINKTTYIDDKDLDKNKQYKYCLEAYDNIHTPSFSNVVTVEKCQETVQSIKGVFIAREVVDNSGDKEVIISQDAHVVNNPPPGFNDLFAPLWQELVP